MTNSKERKSRVRPTPLIEYAVSVQRVPIATGRKVSIMSWDYRSGRMIPVEVREHTANFELVGLVTARGPEEALRLAKEAQLPRVSPSLLAVEPRWS